MLFDALLRKLELDLRASCDAALASARTQLEGGLADLARERAKGLAAVDEERAKGRAEVAKEKADLHREIAAMQKQQEAQQGRIVLDIGGYRYTTSVQTLRRLPGTFFAAYFSGRYTMDRSTDGSIIDRDGKHFGQVLEYLRDGVVSVAERDASKLDVGELRWLKREFGFYCIELFAAPQEVAFAVAGMDDNNKRLTSGERYNLADNVWREAAPMSTARAGFGQGALVGNEVYIIGSEDVDDEPLTTVERYDSSQNTWSAAPSLPRPRFGHCVCATVNAIYVLGGIEQDEEEEGIITVNNVLKFDCQMQTWSEVAPMPEERDRAAACVVDGDIYTFGGKTDDDKRTSTTYRFSTETNEWATLAPLPEVKSCHSVCALDGLIYVMGGDNDVDVDDVDPVGSVHRFDPVANLWSAVAPMCITRSTPGSFVLGGSIYAVGGYSGRGTLSSMERYSVASDSWAEVLGGELSTARDCFGSFVVRLEVDLFDSLIDEAKSEGM
jgi:N-acetylneuraminic acid mutarotase